MKKNKASPKVKVFDNLRVGDLIENPETKDLKARVAFLQSAVNELKYFDRVADIMATMLLESMPVPHLIEKFLSYDDKHEPIQEVLEALHITIISATGRLSTETLSIHTENEKNNESNSGFDYNDKEDGEEIIDADAEYLG